MKTQRIRGDGVVSLQVAFEAGGASGLLTVMIGRDLNESALVRDERLPTFKVEWRERLAC